MADPRDDTEELGPGELPTDAIPVRTLSEEDLDAVVRIDRAATGLSRRDFYEAKIVRALEDSSVQLSLAAEIDDHVVGFLIVSFYYGEFGVPETVAVMEAIGVHPDYRGRNVSAALFRQLDMNLQALGVEKLRTEVDWQQLELMRFLAHIGFAPASRLCLERSIG